MSGSHAVKAWSTTQQVIALSSGEAEYYSMVRGGSMGLGIKAMSEDMGVSLGGVVVKTDASAAKGIASRKGLGKVRHIDVSQLWLQDRVSKGEIVIEKVSTHNNLSDALTKHVDSGILGKHMVSVGLAIVQSRHELMPES
jgi:hypothetical protein